MANEALIIIDVQNDFCPGGALAVADGDAVIAPINRLQSRYPLQILTQDWHPADHSSFASNHQNAEPFSMMDMPYGPQVLWPAHCIQGSDGADFHAGLQTDGGAVIVRKGFRPQIDSYSAFFENDHQTPTGLHGYLSDLGVTSLAMAGLATDFCVGYSAVDAAKLGYQVTLVEDACRAIDLDGSLAKAMQDMVDNGVSIVQSNALG